MENALGKSVAVFLCINLSVLAQTYELSPPPGASLQRPVGVNAARVCSRILSFFHLGRPFVSKAHVFGPETGVKFAGKSISVFQFFKTKQFVPADIRFYWQWIQTGRFFSGYTDGLGMPYYTSTGYYEPGLFQAKASHEIGAREVFMGEDNKLYVAYWTPESFVVRGTLLKVEDSTIHIQMRNGEIRTITASDANVLLIKP